MRKSRRLAILVLGIILIFSSILLSGCDLTPPKYQDGTYTAIQSEFAHGWKEYVVISIINDKIVSIDYNAKNPSGFIKQWDGTYMKVMNAVSRSYPNKYVREYKRQLLETQDPSKVQILTGATNSGHTFISLTEAALEHAKTGDLSVAEVEPEEEHEE
ncbi:MAG: FMN-binding protein [Clostridiales Family XIII bacterium]|nr:FMN-binding protein [Clostridiales Family XIII bacterium]